MRIEKVRVEGYRLLEDIEIVLENNSTVIVGRNNSGKTSFTSIFDSFCGESGARFRLEDFSSLSREKFLKARKLKEEGATSEQIYNALPIITLSLTFRYESDAPNLGPLSPFIIDLDMESTTAIACIEYRPILSKMNLLFDIPQTPLGIENKTHFFKCLRNNLSKIYGVHVSAIDPTDNSNKRNFDGTLEFSALLQCNFVQAQRTLDKSKLGEADVIGKLLSELFKTAAAPTATEADQDLAAKLKESVEDIERNVQSDFDEMLKKLLPVMGVMGFPSLNDTELRPETSLNVEALLSGHTRVVYSGTDGVHLPEGYNGLGTRNLIYMLLQLQSYHKIYRSQITRPSAHLIFIEEPEAHLHPQMQEVFINQLNAAIQKLSSAYPTEDVWNVQFIITTHSSHVANAACFDAVRYFYNQKDAVKNIRNTKVKDFKKGMQTIPTADKEFLHKYMTLTKCDLYFADKVIIVEGTTERLLMPRLRELVDSSLPGNQKLASQYITCVEAGGAHAHLFYPLLDFLELKTLVITDLDSIKLVDKENKHKKKIQVWEKCPVVEGTRTCNTAIRYWFAPRDIQKIEDFHISPAELLAKTPNDKQVNCRRIAYQIPEESNADACARSYEDALILANLKDFALPNEEDAVTEAWEYAKGLTKSDFALEYAIRENEWVVPKYIHEGLVWLSETDALKQNLGSLDEGVAA